MEERQVERTGQSRSPLFMEVACDAELASLQFLDNGILEILSNSTNGLSIVLEHR
jgi:hypothetical protein